MKKSKEKKNIFSNKFWNIFIIIIILLTVTIMNVKQSGETIEVSNYTYKSTPSIKNNVWTVSFQLAWNELMELFNKKIEFVDFNSRMIEELNEKNFTREMLLENSYFIVCTNNKEEAIKQIEERVRRKIQYEKQYN